MDFNFLLTLLHGIVIMNIVLCLQHVHVHVLPRKPGDFSNNDDIYDKVLQI